MAIGRISGPMLYQNLERQGIDLSFEKAALKTIAKNAKDLKTNARGLKNIIEKSNLRNNSIMLLGLMNGLAQSETKDKVSNMKTSLSIVTEIISVLNVSVTVGVISEMNGSILIEGFRTLQLVLNKRQPIFTKDMLNIDEEEILNSNTVLTEAIIGTSYDAVIKSDTVKHSIENYKGQTSKILINKDEDNNQVIKRHSSDGHGINLEKYKESNTINHVGHNKLSNTLSTSFQLRKHTRKDQILALFVKGVDISIKDISSRIKGCSEKTIQRELNNLVFEGKINRIGEKRWSRYILR